MIKESSIDEVRNADILQIIGNAIELKRSGSTYSAKSPFSEDRTASFHVFPKNNNFKCFSSGKGGDGIRFMMLLKSLNFIEAVEAIADICKITLLHEEVSEEAQRKINYKQDMFNMNAVVASRYSNAFSKLDAIHWAQKMIAEREINEETIANFGICYAPSDSQFLTKPIIDKGKFEIAINIGLTISKEGRSYDFFRDKLIFPIHDFKGNIVGFGGRKSNEADGPKYINTKETEIYKKSELLYGLFQAKSHIAESKTAILCEGYTDVTALHQNNCPIAVANCGTASLSDTQCKLLYRFASHVIICRDNDGLDEKGNEQKGTLSALKDIDVLLSQGFKVSIVILPVGEDPDSYSRKIENISEYMLAESQDAVIWKTQKLKDKAANDPDAMSQMVTDIAVMLSNIKDDVKRNSFLDTCRKLIKQPAKVLKDKIESFIKVAEVKATSANAVEHKDAETMGLPSGADFRQFFDKGFVSYENSIYFRGRDKFFKGTNFRITALFHIYGKQDNKRLFEVINERGQKKIIDIDSVDLTNITKFEGKLLDEGDYKLMPDTTNTHFKWMRNDLLSSFIMAYELKTLGWQQEKFFAFANCVYHNGVIKTANDYGIIQLETGIDTESEYMDNIKHFYSPSSSVMYKFTRDGDDPYENDRYFVYKESPVSLNDWMKQLQIVYGKKSTTGIAFIFATLFRDIFLKRYQFFPHLFLSGEKGSGKSKFGESLVALFTYKQEPFDLNSGTPVAFYRRLSRTMNAPTMLEEYHDGLDDKIFQPIKGAYDGRGREMGKATGDNRTTTTKVNCSLILLSQYLSSRDDNSLTSRSLVEHFIKPLESFTTEQIEHYAKLKSWEEAGMSSLICDIIKHRDLVESEIHTTYAAFSKKMKSELKGKEYQERMLQNYLALLVPLEILRPHFHFPFSKEEIWNQFKDAIIDSSDLITESEGLSEFWKTLEFLLDTHVIKDKFQFIIEKPLTVLLQGRKGESGIIWENKQGKTILFLRLNAVHQLYHKEVSRREGVDVITESTLKNYFRSKKYFIGSCKTKRFEDTSTSSYIFDYEMMYEMGILNLTRTGKDNPDELPFNNNSDDVPDWLK